jgi:hypothetical protein
MINDDLVKCPICDGFAHIESPELLAALKDPRIREPGREVCCPTRDAPLDELVNAAAGKPAERDFQKDVHTWNPLVPMWRRSPKRVSFPAALSFRVAEPIKKEEPEESYASQQAGGLGLPPRCATGKN